MLTQHLFSMILLHEPALQNLVADDSIALQRALLLYRGLYRTEKQEPETKSAT